MLDRILRFAFGLTGAITGVTITRFVLVQNGMRDLLNSSRGTLWLLGAAVACGLLMYLLSTKLIQVMTNTLEQTEAFIGRVTLYEMIVAAGGLIAGLIVANLVAIPLYRIPVVGVTLAIMMNVLFGFSGIYFALMKRHENMHGTGGDTLRGASVKLLDTSAIIDGRILDVCRTGFLEGELVVPGFILEELRHLADSHDDLVRAKGRRGLDVLNALKKESRVPVRVERFHIEGSAEVDERLLATAKETGAWIITNDYNLGKVAAIRNLSVLNVNDLANALKPVALSGEEMRVRIIKEGKEAGQGVGYLEDGTMVVVEDGGRFKGQDVEVVVTSVLQTSAGRMVFARYKDPVQPETVAAMVRGEPVKERAALARSFHGT
jgi:uncharacterized protein YacL